MNFSYNIFSGFYDIGISDFKSFTLPITAIVNICIIKFNKLFTHWFFILKKRMNIFKDFRKSFSGKTPNKLVFSSMSVFKPLASSLDKSNSNKETDTPTELHADDIYKAINYLRGNDARTIFNSIKGSNRFGTAPVLDGYFALGHVDIAKDLKNVDGFLNKAQYGSSEGVPPSEEGAVQRARFLLSSKGSYKDAASSNGNRVYNVFFCGIEAFGVVDQDGLSTQMIYRPPIYNSSIAQYATVAWKTRMAHQILNQNWITNLKCTIS